jgi:hypothetical protein
VLSIPTNFVERYGRTLQVPIRIDESLNKDIHTMTLSIKYDSTKVAFLGFERKGALLDSTWTFTPAADPARIAFTASRTDSSLNGEGDLVYMNFRVTFGSGADELHISGTPLAFDTLQSSVNTGAILARYFDGYIYVSGDCLWPLKAGDNYVIISNRPNPFNPSTTILYTLKEAGHVTLSVRDIFGRTIAVLIDGRQPAGEHELYFDGSKLYSGIYFCTIEAAGQRRTIRMVVAK